MVVVMGVDRERPRRIGAEQRFVEEGLAAAHVFRVRVPEQHRWPLRQ